MNNFLTNKLSGIYLAVDLTKNSTQLSNFTKVLADLTIFLAHYYFMRLTNIRTDPGIVATSLKPSSGAGVVWIN